MYEMFIDSLISHQRRMIVNNNRYILEKDVFRTPTGIWYPTFYYKYLCKHGHQKLLKQFISEGAFFHGLAPKECFSQLLDSQSPTGIKVDYFKLKKGTSPSQAIQRLEEDLCFLGCNTFCTISAYKAICSVLNQDKFDYLFAADGPFPLTLTQEATSPLSKILKQHDIDDECEIRKGDFCYFSNIKEYVAKHPVGSSRGYHVLCSQENPHHYIGHGLGVLSGSVEIDQHEIERELLDCYNTEPVDEGFHTSKVWDYLLSFYFRGDVNKGKALVDSYRNRQMPFEQFIKEPPRIHILGKRSKGKMSLSIYRTCWEHIQALIDSPIKSVREVFRRCK